MVATASLALCARGGAPSFGRENAALAAVARQYVAKGLFGGIVCASSNSDFFCTGNRTLSPDGGLMTKDSMFDLASVGKTQTAALCALLYAYGKLDVDAPFTEYVPEHVLAKENCKITVRDLATHSGGFDNSKPYKTADPKAYFEKLYAKRPVRARGEKFEYACSNFVYLGLIVERLTGLGLDAAAKKMLWGPLGMKHTTWNTIVGNPNAVEFADSIYEGKVRRIGEHNDICAHLAPCPMGNGSCFSSASDMLKFCEDMLKREKFPKAYYDLQFSPSYGKGGYRRSFGWDMAAENSTFSRWAKTNFSGAAICHTGWTGPAVAVDPKRSFAGVVLANQLAGKARTMGPRMRMLELMAAMPKG
jgi:N-acetylmuramoyl-L-alanine amidase